MDITTGLPSNQTVYGTLIASPGSTLGTSTAPFASVYATTGNFTDINVSGTIYNTALSDDLTDLGNRIDDIIDDSVTALTSTWSSTKNFNTFNFVPGAFATDLIPDVDDTRDIGTPAKRIKTVHVGDVVITDNLEIPGYPDVDSTLGAHDTHVGTANIHFEQKDIDHVNILNKGTNTHAQIDTNLSTLNTKTQNQTATVSETTFNQRLYVPNSATQTRLHAGLSAKGIVEIDDGATVYSLLNVPPAATQTRLHAGLWAKGVVEIDNGATVYGLLNVPAAATQTRLHAGLSTKGIVEIDDGATVYSLLNVPPAATQTRLHAGLWAKGVVEIDDGATVYGNLAVSGTTTGIDHTALSNIGTNTHAQIDTNLSTLNTKTQNQTATGGLTTFTTDLALQGTNRYEFRNSGPNFNLRALTPNTDIFFFNATNFNLTTPGVRGLYVGPGNRPVVTSGFTATAPGPVCTNTTTEVDITPTTGLGTLTVAANAIIVGSTTSMRVSGPVDSEGKAVNLTLRLRSGGVAGAVIAVQQFTVTSLLNTAFVWELFFTCTAVGVGGTMTASQWAIADTASFSRTGIANIDTTIANPFTLTAQWSNANASNLIQINQLVSYNIYQPMA